MWERLISTVACPIVGLSATLANIQAFYSWLVSIKRIQNESEISLLSDKIANIADNEKLSSLKSDENNGKIVEKIQKKIIFLQKKQKPTDFVDLIIHSERSTALHYYKFQRTNSVINGEEKQILLDNYNSTTMTASISSNNTKNTDNSASNNNLTNMSSAV